LNFTPTSVDWVSASSGVVGVAAAGQIEQALQLIDEGVVGLDAADAPPVPTAFVVATVKVYAVPLVSPGTVADVAGGLPVTVVGARAVDPA
jgi:hypothetical protein